MADWRGYILQHFQTPADRLTLVADPDGLMLEERLIATIHANGFHLLRFDDPIQFRYAYESQFRQKWDQGQDTELVVVLRSPEHDLRGLPYDLLQTGRQLTFRLSDLFPKLSNSVIRELDRADLDDLYSAYRDHRGEVLGDRKTCAYVLTHVFGVAPETLQNSGDVLKHLLSRHYAGRRVPAKLNQFLLERLQEIPGIESWPLSQLLSDRAAFFGFLQVAWPRFLATREAKLSDIHESTIEYTSTAPLLPLDEPDIRAFVDSLFLEGYLHPIPVPPGCRLNSWTSVGIVRAPDVDRKLRFEKLFARVEKELPATSARHQDWLRFARTWSELIVLRYSLFPTESLPGPFAFGDLALAVERRFAEWMGASYLALYNYPPLPAPVMLHHIPYYLASLLQTDQVKRLALLVVDGLAFNQWLLIQAQLRESSADWGFSENGVFAWVPTVTSVSRQSLFAAFPPLNFPSTWDNADRDASHWQRFWQDQRVPAQAIGYFKGPNLDEDPDLESWLADQRSRVAGLVVKKVDDIMHGMKMGTAGMHQQVMLWMQQGHLGHLLTKLSRSGFTTFITADHGNIQATGIGAPKHGTLIDTAGQRALQFNEPAFLEQAQTQYPMAIRWRSDALPEAIHVLLADDLNAFVINAKEIVCHGGISLEEVVVPFVQVTGVPA